MLEFLQIVITFIWAIVSISVPLTPTFSVSIWQFFLFIAVMAITYQQLMKTADNGRR